MSIRKKLIAGNWKMNKTSADASALVQEIVTEVGKQTDVEVVVCPPFTSLETAGKTLDGSSIKLGAQNLHPEKSGAYTGEISAEMLRSLFVNYVIVGHSERRTYFGDTDAFVNQKVLAALKNQLKPILCVGETLAERDANRHHEVLAKQLKGSLAGLDTDQMLDTVIAYEPVWAIGTGRTATPEQAQEAHAFIRKTLTEIFDPATAAKVRIQYGGSVKPDNAKERLHQPDIDGALVGGASLDPRSFAKIVQAAAQS
jgi:triosephosphate isomerase